MSRNALKQESLTIGEVAAQARVNVQTLRYYERRGILPEPKRSSSGYRDYPSETVQLIRFIKRAQDLGFSLDEIEDLLELRRAGTGQRKRVLAKAQEKIRNIEEKLRRLASMRTALLSMVDSCSCKGNDLQCPILDALNEDEPSVMPKSRRLHVIPT
jgi:Hg(II)-responsive transcriptional regulator